nr:response regulator [Desulfobulbaceae bacterium]
MKTLLLVDDEDVIRQALSRNLQKSNYDVTSAVSGAEAVSYLQKKPYDIIVTDYLMEGINGIELMTKARELYPDIKVIVFSGYMEQNFEEALKAADCFLTKPIGLNDLLKAIETVLNK